MLIPSWFFFDDEFGAGCHVSVRSGDAVATLGEWRSALPPVARRPWHLFHSPRSNMRLFTLSSFERLLDEAQSHIAKPQELLERESYILCLALLREALPLKNARFFQFKVSAVLEHDTSGTLQDAFVSKVHEA